MDEANTDENNFTEAKRRQATKSQHAERCKKKTLKKGIQPSLMPKEADRLKSPHGIGRFIKGFN